MGDADIEGLLDAQDVFRHAFYVRYGCCSRRSCGVICFGSSCKSVSVSSNEVVIVVVL